MRANAPLRAVVRACQKNRHIYEIIHENKPRKGVLDIDKKVPLETPAVECQALFVKLQEDARALIPYIFGETRFSCPGASE